MRQKIPVLLLLLSLLTVTVGVTGCDLLEQLLGSGDGPGGSDGKNGTSGTALVYIAGYSTEDMDATTWYWEGAVDGNGQITDGLWLCAPDITILHDSSDSAAWDIAVDGGTVYVTGWHYDDYWYSRFPCVWEDGVRKDLALFDDEMDSGESLAISGDGRYYAGWIDVSDLGSLEEACVWIDSEVYPLVVQADNDGSRVTGMVSDGSTLHMCGYTVVDDWYNTNQANYWTANPFVGTNDGWYLPLPDGATGAVAADIVLAGNDLYIAGSYTDGGTDVICYWRNGDIRVDVATAEYANATCIAVEGGTVFIGGFFGDDQWEYFACVWKSDATGDTRMEMNSGDSAVSDIAVLNGNLHAAGYVERTSGFQAVYWFLSDEDIAQMQLETEVANPEQHVLTSASWQTEATAIYATY